MSRINDLPGNWTDLSNGMTLRQAENLFDALSQTGEITVFQYEKPAAVLLSIESYQRLVRMPDINPPKEFPA